MSRPRLKIHMAIFGGTDFTKEIQNLVQADQTLTLTTQYPDWKNFYNWHDPWVGVLKSLTILYQWGDRPLELVVTSEFGGLVILDPMVPVSTTRTMFLNPAGGRVNSRDFQIFTIVWGCMQGLLTTVPASMYTSVQATGFFTPSNSFFNFDGCPGVVKTAIIIYKLRND